MRSRSRSSLLTVFCICSILIVGYDGDGVNAQDLDSWYPDTTTTTSPPTDSTSTSTSTSSSSTSTSTGSWFPTSIPTTTPPVTTDYPTRPPTPAPTPTPASDPYDPYPYPTYPPTSPSGPTYYPDPYPEYPTSPSYPTAYPTTAPDVADRGTFWPWDTQRGVLPTVQPATSLNPDYDPSSYYVVWVVSATDSNIANSTVPSPSSSSSSSLISVSVRESGDGIYFCARYSSWSSSQSFYDILYGYNRAYYSNGVLEQFVKISSIDFSRLLMQFSYLDSSNRIPVRHSSATSSSSSYYITARSRMGEFRMFYSRSYSDAHDMYYACCNERGKDGKLYWETVKTVKNGQVLIQTAGSRGSTLEHMGAFQWLEFYRYPSSSSSYLLISWRSLSGVRLSRYHEYSWYDSSRASAAYDWNVWYNEMYQPSNNYNYGMNNPVIILYQNGALTRSTYTNYNDFLQLQQDYYSLVHTTTSVPTSRPYPYPYPYPTQSPYPYPYPYPYPTPSPYKPYNRDFTFTRNWSDLSNADRTFIIAYPIAIIGFGIILILITTCCIKCRDRRATSGAAAAVAAGAPITSASASSPASVPIPSLSARFHNLSTVGILLSFLSLIFLIVALIVNQFSFATFGTYTWVSYGPFSTVQTSPWRGWLNMYWTAQVFGPTTAAVILFNILLLITNAIQLINIKRSNDFTNRRVSRPVILTCACFIMSCTAVMIWFLIHVRLLDPALARMVIDNYNNSKSYYSYSSQFIVKIGTSAILLIIATGIQCATLVPMCRFIHLARQAQGQGQVPSMLLSVATVDFGDQQTTSTRAQQAEQDGLQLVQIGSQYYYRAGPAPVPAAATPYVYGVPTSGPVSYAPPVASAPPAIASTYYPGYVPPSFQALATPAPIPTTSISVPLSHTAAPAPVPAPSSSLYPALPVEVPQSGPNTRYQRLL